MFLKQSELTVACPHLVVSLLYTHFASIEQQSEFKNDYKEGISWGDAKNKLFNLINLELMPIRDKYNKLQEDKNLVNELLDAGAAKVRPLASEMLGELREIVGISKIE